MCEIMPQNYNSWIKKIKGPIIYIYFILYDEITDLFLVSFKHFIISLSFNAWQGQQERTYTAEV